MRSTFSLCITSLLLAACITKPAEVRVPTVHDLGAPGPVQAPVMPLRRVEVTTPGWLNAAVMQYRQGEQTSARKAFADNRWVAPPGDLIENSLMRALGAAQPSRCTLTVRLDELVQVFDSDSASRVRMSGVLFLKGGPTSELMAQRAFDLNDATPSADPAGGAATVRTEADKLAGLAREWLATMDAKACAAGG
ncbi:ABC-type transport auxiliary lipoprotein family protein [Niveibacterium sp. SC-1]|uniref:ABC-type transport auxiliary lipoprotein family protein n=1 Tax=Niveibacterium sp. SC-1 TaxID=3135646 RepID=UPI00311D8133